MSSCAWEPLKSHLHHTNCREMGKPKVFMKVVQGRQSRMVEQWGVVKGCAGGAIYIHMLQQDLCDLFNKDTNPA